MHDDESSSSSASGVAAAAASSSASASAAARRPSEFGKAFATKLESLKSTDKQTITSLTILADEHRDRADEVVEILKRRMQQLPSGDHRLPLMYLIDSICQNLGKKGAEYPRKMQPHIKPMLQHMLRHCSLKVKGSLYRMCAAWKRGHTFNKEPLAEIETMFHAFMTPEEREEALARRSAAGPAAPQPEDPRKRAHSGSTAAMPSPSASPSYGTETSAFAAAPTAKKAMLLAPRRPPAGPAAAGTEAAPAMIPEAAQFSLILASPDIAGRVELRGVVASMQKQLRRALPIEEMKALVAKLVVQLQQALAVAPPPQPQPAAALPLPMPLPAPTFNPYAPAPVPAMPLPLPMSLPPQPPAQAWNPAPLPLPSVLPPYRSPNAQAPQRVEVCGRSAQTHIQQQTQCSLFLNPNLARLLTPRSLAVPLRNRLLDPSRSRRRISKRQCDLRWSSMRGNGFVVVCLLWLWIARSHLWLFCSACFLFAPSRHPWLANSLYTAIPLVCKSCGRRIHTNAEMGSHLDWHFQMSKRAALIAKTQSGSKWQNWYWPAEEWIMATDVIFGVQNRTPSATAAAKAKGAASTGAAAKGYTPASLVADDTQPSCAICAEEFKKEWSDEDENWMYREVIRLGAEEVAKAREEIARIESEKPPPAAQEMDEEARALAAVASGGILAPSAPSPAAAAATNSTQTAALASKESDRLQSLWRAEKVLKHTSMFAGRIVHQACHYGVMANIAKMVRPKEGEDREKDGATAEGAEHSSRRDGASPAPGASAASAASAKLESTVKPEPQQLPLKTETKLEPLPALE